VRLGLCSIAVVTLGFAAPAGSSDRLRIVIWPRGTTSTTRVTWTLRCNPPGGTLPRTGRACRALASLERPFAPVPSGVACSEIYGGPQVALVTGSFRGRRVWARFRRTDSCQTGRWNRIAFLFPLPAGG
jgi:Subtilisin inhibitor-like